MPPKEPQPFTRDVADQRLHHVANQYEGFATVCGQCNCANLVVAVTQHITAIYTSTLACHHSCPNHSGGVAAVRETVRQTISEKLGTVIEGRGIEWHGTQFVADVFVDDTVEIICRTCFQNAHDDDWDHDLEPEVEDGPDDNEWQMRCATCGNDIEFGWSGPDREGRICLVGSSDV